MFPLSRPEGSFYCTESVPEEPLEIKTFNSEDVERMSRWRNKEAEVRSCCSYSLLSLFAFGFTVLHLAAILMRQMFFAGVFWISVMLHNVTVMLVKY